GLDDRAGDKEDQSGPPDVHRPLVEQPGELVEELGNVLIADADPLIMDGDFRLAVFGGRGDDGDIAAPGGVLDGVVEQVQQRLLKPAAVTAYQQARLDTDPHRITARVSGKEINHFLDELGQI